MPDDPAELAKAMFRQADKKMRTEKSAKINCVNLVKLGI